MHVPTAALMRNQSKGGKAGASWLFDRGLVTTDLDLLRLRASRAFAMLLWGHVPVIAAIAYSNGVPIWRPIAIMAIAATIGSLFAWRAGSTLAARLIIAAALTVAPALMVYAGRGPWQIDWHMYFFVIFGMLVAFVDWRPIAVSAGLTAVHHLLLDLIFPESVFPEAGLGRVLLHAAIVIVDCGVLFWIVSQMQRLFATSSAALQVAQAAAGEAQRLESYAKHGSDLIMQAVNQGLLLCDADFVIQPQYSAELEKIFETEDLAGRNFLTLLQGLLTERLYNTTRDYIALLFDVKRKERTVLKVNPLSEVECSFWNRGGGSFSSKVLNFSFRRIVEDGVVSRVFVAVNDISERVKLERQLSEAEGKKERQVELLLSILHIDLPALDEFVVTAKEQMETMSGVLRPQDFAANSTERQHLRKRLDAIFRSVHNLKGNAALIKFTYFQKRAEEFEAKLSELRNRTNLGGDDFLSVVGLQAEMHSDIDDLQELRGKFATAPRSSETAPAPIAKGFTGSANGANGTSRHPHDDVVLAVVTLARSLGVQYGKEVRVDATGFDTRTLASPERNAIRDALIALTRNSIMHGVETPEFRAAAGKRACATLTIRPFHARSGEFAFVFRDDGRGFDTERIRNRAIATGLMSGEDSRSYGDDSKIVRLIFEPGFSTVDHATEESGRGMGMNLIKQRIVDDCKGSISVNSEPGRFCEFKIGVPIVQLVHS
jgi:HPt (histidine-containing phosphotransfer) domain-containing protein/PAS domain-containing protein